MTETTPVPGGRARPIGLLAGPLAAATLFLILPETIGPEVPFPAAGRATAALAAWMGIWWLTEAVPLAATALLPIAIFPILGIAPVDAATSPYAEPMIFLLLGGFLLALSMERWGLHLRIALIVLRLFGTRPRGIVAGFMGATALLSMWVSNTATVAMLLPVAASIVSLVGADRNFRTCLLLGIAYAASIGGIGTPIGTPPNLLLASYLREHLGIEISFVRWFGIGLPIVAVFLPVAWWLLVRFLHPLGNAPIEGGREAIRKAQADLGPVKPGEWATFLVFTATASAWIFRPLLARIEFAGIRPLAGLTDPGIAVAAALLLFVIPAGGGERVMDWKTARKIPWGILILFGGGLSLAAAIESNGVADALGRASGILRGTPGPIAVLAVTAGVILLTEITSNTATVATLLPVLAAVAPAIGVPPVLLLVPAALAASCAFMMPVATPPNAIVFGTGDLTIRQMARAGLVMNGIGTLLITLAAYATVLPLLGAGG